MDFRVISMESKTSLMLITQWKKEHMSKSNVISCEREKKHPEILANFVTHRPK